MRSWTGQVRAGAVTLLAATTAVVGAAGTVPAAGQEGSTVCAKALEPFPEPPEGTAGGIHPAPADDADVQEMAAWAVAEANRVEARGPDTAYRLECVATAGRQIVAGSLYHLNLRLDRPEPHQVTAVVWDKPWENFRELQSFSRTDDAP
ncbi:cystatin family protein [Streptomyces sp. T-3]|nr:cystatin family protein [Streptomyces sp. T-3]